jgi:heme oxygenase (biliverdin-IX-beta and delta-forming)
MMLLSEYLKNSTAGIHKELEAASGSQKIFDHSYSLAQYGSMLQSSYLFNHAVEKHFEAYGNFFEKLYLSGRNKCAYLQQDLHELNAEIPAGDKSIILTNAAQFLGALYVAEGAMLGGQVIKKQLQKNAAFFNCTAFRYYTCYGENLRNRWTDFIDVLNNFGQKYPEQNDDVLAGALGAFLFYKTLIPVTSGEMPASC